MSRLNVNAESGPSRLRGLSISSSSSTSASPINIVDELDDPKDFSNGHGHLAQLQPHHYVNAQQLAHMQQQGLQQGHGQGQGQGQGVQGINRNGLRVAEDGEVTRVPAFLTKLFRYIYILMRKDMMRGMSKDIRAMGRNIRDGGRKAQE